MENILKSILNAILKERFTDKELDDFQEMIENTFKAVAKEKNRYLPANSTTFQAYSVGFLHGQVSIEKKVGDRTAKLAHLVADRALEREKEQARKQADAIMSADTKQG